MNVYCIHNLKAIHNKDYSVVKTFRAAGFLSLSFLEMFYLCQRNSIAEVLA